MFHFRHLLILSMLLVFTLAGACAQSGKEARKTKNEDADREKKYNSIITKHQKSILNLQARVRNLAFKINKLDKKNKENIRRLRRMIDSLENDIGILDEKVRKLKGKNATLTGDFILAVNLGTHEIERLEGVITLLESTMQEYTKVIGRIRDTLFVRSIKVLAIQKKGLLGNKFANQKITTNWRNTARIKAARVKTLVLNFDTGAEYPNPKTLYFTLHYRKRPFKSENDLANFTALSEKYKERNFVFNYECGCVTTTRQNNNEQNNTRQSNTRQSNQQKKTIKPGYDIYKKGKGSQIEKLKKGSYMLEIFYKEGNNKKQIVNKKGYYLFYLK